MSLSSDPLDPLLDRWADSSEPAPPLAAEVWRRIAIAESGARAPGGFWAAAPGWLVRPQFAALLAITCALLALYLAQVRVTAREREHSSLLARSYLQLIDPLLNGQPPLQGASLDGELAWIKADLHLSEAQFARIKELHEVSSPRLRALGSQVARMQAEFTAFENTRRASDHIDFIAFAHFVELRRDIDRQCRESTRQLVLAASSEMNPVQRARYLGILASAAPPARMAN